MLYNKYCTEHAAHTIMYKNDVQTCCTDHVEQKNVHKMLYRKRCTINDAQQMLYRKCCTQKAVHKMLYKKLCTENAVQ